MPDNYDYSQNIKEELFKTFLEKIDDIGEFFNWFNVFAGALLIVVMYFLLGGIHYMYTTKIVPDKVDSYYIESSECGYAVKGHRNHGNSIVAYCSSNFQYAIIAKNELNK